MMPELLVSIERGVQKIIFNRPKKLNAISSTIYIDLQKILKEGASNPDVNITVITGNGDYFSSGNDIGNYTANTEITPDFVKNQSLNLQSYVRAFIDYPKILIAILNGPAIGISATILGLFDIVYATEKATIHTPFSKLGLSPEGCSSFTFPRIFGPSVANEMLCLNKIMTAQEAKEYGFISEIYSKKDINDVLWPKIYKYATFPPESILYSKRLIREPLLKELHEANVRECERLEERWQSAEFFNALVSFLQRKGDKSKL